LRRGDAAEKRGEERPAASIIKKKKQRAQCISASENIDKRGHRKAWWLEERGVGQKADRGHLRRALHGLEVDIPRGEVWKTREWGRGRKPGV